MPSLRSLRAFTYAGRYLSFKVAAEHLFLTASAVSHQVRNLEEFLGVPLFVRKTRALEFTEAGKKYFDFLDEMFARLEAETHQLWSEYGRKIVRMCVPHFFANELLLPKLDALHALMPDTDIRVTTQTSLMKEHPAEADLSILLGDEDEFPNLVTHLLFTRSLVVAAAPALLKGFDRRHYKSLDGQTLIVHENRPNAWTNWSKALKAPLPKAGKILRFDSMSTVVQAAASGLGFAIVSWPLSEQWFESGKLVKVFDTEWITDESFYLAHRPGEQDRADIARTSEWLLQQFRRDD
jgi:DNA-binding transcriptional LysR family regulator